MSVKAAFIGQSCLEGEQREKVGIFVVVLTAVLVAPSSRRQWTANESERNGLSILSLAFMRHTIARVAIERACMIFWPRACLPNAVDARWTWSEGTRL